jgi:hypothetical protein
VQCSEKMKNNKAESTLESFRVIKFMWYFWLDNR